MSLSFAHCVRVLPELSQCSGKLSLGTHDSTRTGSYHNSSLCKKIARLPHILTHSIMHRANCITKEREPCYGYSRSNYSTEYKTYQTQTEDRDRIEVKREDKTQTLMGLFFWCDMYRLAKRLWSHELFMCT